MFMEYLSAHPMKQLLGHTPIHLFPSLRDRASWEALPEARRQSIRDAARHYQQTSYPALKATQFMAYFRTSSRVVWEDPYFTRRRKLIAAVLARCVRGPEGPESLDEIVDGLWLICEESSWVLSAHNRDGDVYEGAVLHPPADPPGNRASRPAALRAPERFLVDGRSAQGYQ